MTDEVKVIRTISLRTTTVLLAVCLVIGILLLALLLDTQAQYETMALKYAYVDQSIDGLRSEKNALQAEVDKLRTEYSNLQSSLRLTETDLARLQTDFSALQSLHQECQISNDLRIGNSLASFYDALRYKHGLPADADQWAIRKDLVNFAANLALHDLGQPSFFDRSLFELTYYAQVGTHSYEKAWKKLQAALSATGIEHVDAPATKIEKILEFLSSYLTYESEVGGIFRAPVETLSLRSGDCDDYSILAAALFEAVGMESAIGFFQNVEGKSHAMVLVHLEDLGHYRFWYYDDLTSSGLRPGRWIRIEPQSTIEDQGNAEWMNQWNLTVAAEVESG